MEMMDQSGENPFFLYLAHYAPHTPIEAPLNLVEKYRQKLRPEYQHQNPTYSAMIENLDSNVGRIIEHLKKNGKFDNTLILFTSDNGGYLGDPKGRNGVVTTNAPLRSGKGSLYEGGIRVPLIIKLPISNQKQSIIDERVVTTDLHETVLNMAGYNSGKNSQLSDGIDLNPMIKHTSSDWPIRPLFFHYPHYYETTSPVSAIIHKNFKLLHYAESDGIELYDLSKDPYETSNIAHAEEIIAQEMKTLLIKWKQSVGAKEPRINPHFQPSKK